MLNRKKKVICRRNGILECKRKLTFRIGVEDF